MIELYFQEPFILVLLCLQIDGTQWLYARPFSVAPKLNGRESTCFSSPTWWLHVTLYYLYSIWNANETDLNDYGVSVDGSYVFLYASEGCHLFIVVIQRIFHVWQVISCTYRRKFYSFSTKQTFKINKNIFVCV